MSTPQVQVKRLRKELAREEDVRDELERELAEHIGLLSEKGLKRANSDLALNLGSRVLDVVRFSSVRA